jgi:hypothetical protein
METAGNTVNEIVPIAIIGTYWWVTKKSEGSVRGTV